MERHSTVWSGSQTTMAKAAIPRRTLKRPPGLIYNAYHAVNDVAKLKTKTDPSNLGGIGATISEFDQ